MGTNPYMTGGYSDMSMFGAGENKANISPFDVPFSPEVLGKIQKPHSSATG